jgi:hypothetical protein
MTLLHATNGPAGIPAGGTSGHDSSSAALLTSAAGPAGEPPECPVAGVVGYRLGGRVVPLEPAPAADPRTGDAGRSGPVALDNDS